MIQHSDGISNIMAAILAVQGDVDHVEKTEKNPHFGNTYADLNTFLRALRGPLAEHGIVMTQAPGMDGEHVTVETMLHHESGEWLRNRASCPMQKSDPQGVGSAITYLRRYSLAALFAVPQEDDDGNAASRSQRRNGKQNVNRSTGELEEPTCPRCEGAVWDNRKKKESGEFSPRSPDFACRDKDGCGWTLWLDGAEEKLKGRLKSALDGGIISQEQYDQNVESVEAACEGGDLDQLRITTNWIRGLETVKTGEEQEETTKEGAAV